ncbi:class I SAM-dependent methyltransferase [Streptomyces sp. NPDC048331]|uniref:class I SAM-dependent methyltransferase n=1 Tax=Streptomyces sp. NPDC048331 TaxID=3365534 RepID=UPI003714C305
MARQRTARRVRPRTIQGVRLHTVEDWQAFNLEQPGREVSSTELDMFRRRVPLQEKMRVLDIGCGNGRWTRELAKLGLEVTGFDWDSAAVERASSLPALCPRPDYQVWDAMSQDPPDWIEPGTVDLVTFRYSLGAMKPALVLPVVGTMLKAGGQVYILTDLDRVNVDDRTQLTPGLTEAKIRSLGKGWGHMEVWSFGLRTAITLAGYGT